MNSLGTFRLVDLVVSSTNHQPADLDGDISLVAQLSVNDSEPVEEVECPKSMNDGQWRPNFMTDLATTVERYRITLIKTGLERRVLGFVELTGAEVLAGFISLQDRLESTLIGDINNLHPLRISFSATFSFQDSSEQWLYANTSSSILGYFSTLYPIIPIPEIDFDFLHHVTLLITGAERKAEYLWRLAIFSRSRWERSETSACRDQAVAVYEDASTLTSIDHSEKVQLMVQLAGWLCDRYRDRENISDLHRAISVLEETLELAPSEHRLRPRAVFILNKCRFLLTDHTSLEKGVSILKVETDPSVSLHTGVDLLNRFLASGSVGDIDRAVLHFRRALASHGSPSRMDCLGAALLSRYERYRDTRDLNEAIALISEALVLEPDKGSNIRYSHNLASCLKARYDITHSDEDINRAMELSGKVAQETPDNNPHKCILMSGWASSYTARYKHTKDIQDLARAISILEDGVEIDSVGPALPGVLSSLALGLLEYFIQKQDPRSIHKAVQAQLRAIDLMPETHHELPGHYKALGKMYLGRASIPPHPDMGDLKLAMIQFSRAARMRTGPPEVQIDAAFRWVELAGFLHDPSCMEAYATSLDLLPQIAWLGLSLEQRHKQLAFSSAPSTGTITLEAAAMAVEQGENERAVEWLEQGRSVVWGQLLQLRAPADALRKAHPDVAARLMGLSNSIEQDLPMRRVPMSREVGTPNVADGMAERYRRTTLEWEKLIKEIRRLPGFERFLMPRTLAQLSMAAALGPIVTLNASEHRCDALVLLPDMDNVLHIPLYNFTWESAQRMQKTISRLLWGSGRCIESEPDRFGNMVVPPNRPRVDMDTTFAECLKKLWDDVVKPVLDGLALTSTHSFGSDDLPRVWWCPTGPLSSLPLHAAGDYGTTDPGSKASDFIISSYIPTISSLLHDLDPAPSNPPKILAIAQPSSIGQHDLPGTLDELKVISQKAKNYTVSQLVGVDATVEAVSAEMRGANWVHFACHGVQSASCPTDSALLLADTQRLRLSEIIKMNLPNAQLAFLSACQTATGARDLPDEAVHLAAGMLMAGYRGVIATMWSIADTDAPQVAGDVYGMFLEGEGVPDHRQAARALHFAVKRLREGYGNRSFLRWVPYIHIGA